jgi:two-component system chemotaxis response regulator CheY
VKILVADADTAQRRRLRNQLGNLGYDVLEAHDGQSAWSLLQAEPVRLVLTDWLMPLIDGPELVRRIRAMSLPIYVILMTARNWSDEVIDEQVIGVDDHLCKPFAPREVRARVLLGLRLLELEHRLDEALTHYRTLATYDSLTGLLNRHSIYDHAAAEVNRAIRNNLPVSVVLVGLKGILHEHTPPGLEDRVLRLTADTIVRSLRPYDWVGRWSRSEFMLVLTGTSGDEARIVAQRVQENILQANRAIPPDEGGPPPLHVYCGTTHIAANEELSLDRLISRAESDLRDALLNE